MSAEGIPLRLFVYTARYTGRDLTADLDDILARSTRNNRRDGITGALLVDSDVFVQAIEGPGEAIGRLLDRIRADGRCGAIDVLIDTATGHRSAWEWTLRVARLDADAGIDADALRAFRDAYLSGFRPDAAGFIELLNALIGRVRAHAAPTG